MKILLVSDTHGKDENLELAVEAARPFDLLAHCGDVEGREYYIEALAETPCLFVAGNNDFWSDLESENVLTLENHRIFMTHGHYYGVSRGPEKLADEARRRYCDTVFYGHIHRPVWEVVGGVTMLNPGSLTYPRQTGRRPSYMVLECVPTGPVRPEIFYL